jgi:curved DNA-binding protein CbpA
MTYYLILNLKENCTKYDITLSYIKLSRKYHPDNSKYGNINSFKLISEAYEILINDYKREIYDNSDKNILYDNYINPFDIYNKFFNKSNNGIIKSYIGKKLYDDYFFEDNVKKSYILNTIKLY